MGRQGSSFGAVVPRGRGGGSCTSSPDPRAAPAKAEGSLGPAAGAGQAAVPDSAESPAACSGTGAGPAGTPGDSLLLAKGRHVVRHHAGLPEAWKGGEARCLDSGHPTCTLPNPLTCFRGWLLGYLALLDRTVLWLRAPRYSLSGVLFSSNAQTSCYLLSVCSGLTRHR